MLKTTEDITDADYTHAERVCKDRQISGFACSKRHIITSLCN